RQRVDEALELCGQHQVDEAQRERESHEQRRRRLQELARLAVVVDRVAGLQVLGGIALDRLDRLAERRLRAEARGDRDRAALPEVIQLARADPLAHAGQARQRQQLAAAAANENPRDVLRRRPVVLGELDDDVVLLAVALEARDLAPAQRRLERAP